MARRDENDDAVIAADGTLELIDDPGDQGELVLRPGWPSMFRTYLGEQERYEKCFAGGWYLSGDLVRRDRDGYFWFVGRGDDVIKSSGHLIGGPAKIRAKSTSALLCASQRPELTFAADQTDFQSASDGPSAADRPSK